MIYIIFINKAKHYGAIFSGLILLWSCVVGNQKIKEATNIDIPSSIVENFTSISIDSGLIQAKIIAPKMIEYDNPIHQYQEFPDGIEVFTFEKDSIVTGFLRADYAIKNTADSATWEGRGNVILVNSNNDSIFSDNMIWDRNKNEIYNNILTKIKKHSGGEIISELGFVAKLNSKGVEEYRLKSNKGKLFVRDKEEEDK